MLKLTNLHLNNNKTICKYKFSLIPFLSHFCHKPRWISPLPVKSTTTLSSLNNLQSVHDKVEKSAMVLDSNTSSYNELIQSNLEIGFLFFVFWWGSSKSVLELALGSMNLAFWGEFWCFGSWWRRGDKDKLFFNKKVQ